MTTSLAIPKISDELIRDREDVYKFLLDNSREIILVLSKTGRILFANKTAVGTFGYSEKEILGRSITNFLTKDSIKRSLLALAQEFLGHPQPEMEVKAKTKLGELRYLRIAMGSAAIHDKGKLIGVMVCGTDITEQKRMETSLKESESRYEDLVEKAGIGILVDDREGNFQYCNKRYPEIFGYSQKEMKKLSIRSVVHPEDVERVMAYHIGRLQGNPVPTRYEFKGIRKDGTTIYLEVDTVALGERQNMVGTRSYVRDITQRKLAERALRESEEKFRNLAEQSPNMIFINQGGRVVYANKKCEEVMGYSREEICSPDFDFLVLIAPESKDIIRANFQKHMRGEDVSPYRYSLLTRTGTRIEALLTARLIDYGDGRAILGIVADITEQKKAEKIRDSIYRISEAAHSAQDLEDLFRLIHKIIGELMPAKDFYIALFDYATGMLSFPYFVDEYDKTPMPKSPGKGLTEYVLRTGRPLLASPEVFEELVINGEVESIGTPSIDWLGVPLKAEDKTFGVLAVQSYTEGVRFGEEEKEILKFVSDQIATAIKRKHAEEQLKRSLREKDMLLQEIHHRVKNNMQLISSLLNLQASQSKDDDFMKMVKASQSRIRSMALVHEKLYRSRDLSSINFSEYVQTFAVHLFQLNQVNSDLVRLRMNLEDVFLDVRTAIPCGLILNELITNSLKHAFPDGRSGEITVGLHPLDEQFFQIIVKDNGVGIPKDLEVSQATTMGLQIVTSLVQQLEGSMEVHREGGTAIKIAFKESRFKSRL